MKKRLKNTIALVIVMSVILSIVAIPVHAEAGLSEALREDDDLGLFGVGITVFMVLGSVILIPILLVSALIFGEEATIDTLHDVLGNLVYG